MSLFLNRFRFLKSKKTAIYGIGDIAKILLEDFDNELDIVCLLDGFRETGEMFAKPIFPLRDVVNRNVEAIIIAARAASTKIIFRRIENFCKLHNISVYDIQANDLTKAKQDELPSFVSSQKISEKDIKDRILAHDIISFDIFDTLLVRKTLSPEDAFLIIQKRSQLNGFYACRKEAEHFLSAGGHVPTFDEIYDYVKEKFNLSHEQAERLKAIEIATEDETLIPRQDVVGMLAFAKANAKKVFLVSDMYLPKKILSSILKNKNIQNYDDIFLSCEYGTNKLQNLYAVFRAAAGDGRYLHIGDRELEDGDCAARFGIDTAQALSSSELFRHSSWNKITKIKMNCAERNVMGEIVAHFFNSPFLPDKPMITSPHSLGKYFIAPLLVDFLTKILPMIRKKYDAVLWGARDGYLLHNLYRKIYGGLIEKERLPRSVYFYISRAAAISATISNMSDLSYAMKLPFSGSVEKMLSFRFCLDKNEILQRNVYETDDEYIFRHSDAILRKSAELRRNYQKYIEQSAIHNIKKPLFFDFVSTGTCQMCLEKLLGRKIAGVYFIHILDGDERKENLQIFPCFGESNVVDMNSNLANNYTFAENFLMPKDGSIWHFDENGQPVFMRDMRSAKFFAGIEDAQRGVMDFADWFVQHFSSYEDIFSVRFLDELYGLLDKSEICINDLSTEDVWDEFANRNSKFLSA